MDYESCNDVDKIRIDDFKRHRGSFGADSAKSKSSTTSINSIDFCSSEHSTPEVTDEYFLRPAQYKTNVLEMINEKITKLDAVLQDFRELALESRLSNFENVRPVSQSKAHSKALVLEKEKKEIHQFAGIYSIKSAFYGTKVAIPGGNLSTETESTNNKTKLIELFQFPGYNNDKYTPLPHGLKIEHIVSKVLNSIKLLKRQPKYGKFLEKYFSTNEFKFIIHDLFWWCFIERYQKTLHTIQQHLFQRISKNYVKTILMNLDFVYRETFFKQYPNLLATTTYTAFCSCFPASYTQFGHEFKDFICNICYMWLSGCRPQPRSYSNWNFKMLDPPQALFAEEVLASKNKNIIAKDSEINKNSTDWKNHQSDFKLKSHAASRNHNSRDIKSHPIGKGPEFENSVFDVYGNSPLVDCFLKNTNLKKSETVETLIHHPLVVSLPPLGSKTYSDVISESLVTSHNIADGYKKLRRKHKQQIIRIETENSKFFRTLSQKEKRLLEKSHEVKYLGDLITLETKKDSKSTSFGADIALEKALNNV